MRTDWIDAPRVGAQAQRDGTRTRFGTAGLGLGLLAAIAGFAGAATPAELRSVMISIVDAQGAPVSGITIDEAAVLENGLVREIRHLEPDRRPLAVALVVDTSEAAGPSLRLHVSRALADFVGRLPADSHLALWTTGDRPTLAVGFTNERVRVLESLKRLVPRGGNTLLDSLQEASRALRQREGERGVVVVVTAMGVDFSNLDRRRVVAEGSATGSMFYAVQIDEGGTSLDDRQDYDFTLAGLADGSDGVREAVLSPMGVGSALARIASDILGQYRLSYASISDVKNRKLEVKLARLDLKVRVGRLTR